MFLSTFRLNDEQIMSKLKKRRFEMCHVCKKEKLSSLVKVSHNFISNDLGTTIKMFFVKLKASHCFNCSKSDKPNYDASSQTLLAEFNVNNIDNEGMATFMNGIIMFKKIQRDKRKDKRDGIIRTLDEIKKDFKRRTSHGKVREVFTKGMINEDGKSKRIVRKTKMHSAVRVIFKKDQDTNQTPTQDYSNGV